MLKFISWLYTFWVKRGFTGFGKKSIIKPLANITGKQFISIGENVQVGSFCWLGVDIQFAGMRCKSGNKIRLSIGDNTTIGNNCVITANNKVVIGRNCIFSSYVFVSDHIHEYKDISKNLSQQPLSEDGFVIIKDNVFVGIKASIMRNIEIGEHSVVGANAVVAENVPSYTVVVGNPAKIIKKYDFDQKKWVSFKSID